MDWELHSLLQVLDWESFPQDTYTGVFLLVVYTWTLGHMGLDHTGFFLAEEEQAHNEECPG